MTGKPQYSIHKDLDYVSISKFISYKKGWKRIKSIHIDELIKKLGLENK